METHSMSSIFLPLHFITPCSVVHYPSLTLTFCEAKGKSMAFPPTFVYHVVILPSHL